MKYANQWTVKAFLKNGELYGSYLGIGKSENEAIEWARGENPILAEDEKTYRFSLTAERD